MRHPIRLSGLFLLLVAGSLIAERASAQPAANDLRFRIQLTDDAVRQVAALGLETPVHGRVYVVVSTDSTAEPRRQVDVTGVPFWGMDVADLAGGDSVVLAPDGPAFFGYPLARIADLPPGDYFVQAFLNVYTTFERGDGHTVRMHLNAGEGQNPWIAPGNVHSRVERLHLDPAAGGTIALTLDEVIPPIEPLQPGEVLQQGNPRDTEWVKYVKIQSDVLSAFWGRPMYIGANVLLPKGYDEHPDVRYPVLYLQGHFPGRSAPLGFEPGNPGRGASAGLADFWTSDGAPRFIAVTFRDANPYYDTSYSVNSENVGPYGDAITQELIPYLESHFRIRREPWARLLAGGSTGGWEALAMQVFYPDLFGGAWGWCPDPVDFNYFQIVDVYDDPNAYVLDHGWTQVERPNARRPDGNVISTVRMENYLEEATGTSSRGAGQWDIWHAVYSPVGADGYPQPIWDPVTGVIDHDVAAYWREHYDLHAHLARHWPELGPKLRGKLHIATGDMDTYYLEQAVYLLDDFLASVDHPPADATVTYGRRQPHCWIGESPNRPGEEMTYVEFLQQAAAYLRTRAPEGADTTSWWY